MPLIDYQTLVSDTVRDVSDIITDEQRDNAIAFAAIRYSADRPREIVEAVTPDGSSRMSLPSVWIAHHSRLLEVAASGGEVIGEPVVTLDGLVLILTRPIAAAESCTLRYSTLHLIEAVEDTIPLIDREAVGSYAAALILEQLANYYSGTKSSMLDADTVDWQSKGRDYGARAKTLRSRYLDHLGIDLKRNVAAGTVVDLDRGDSRGRDRIFHSQRRR